MSEFFRLRVPADLASAGLTTLARLTHDAEDNGDDVLLMQCAAVVESRGEQEIFHTIYLEQWNERMSKKKPKSKRGTP